MHALRLCFLLGWGAVEAVAEWRIVGSDLLSGEFAGALELVAERGETKLTTKFAGSHAGWKNLQAGQADVALLSFPPGQALPGEPWHCLPLAYHVVAVLVTGELPVSSISFEGLAGIYGTTGRAGHVRWGDLGLTGDRAMREIIPHGLAARSGLSQALVRHEVLGARDYKSGLTEHATPGELVARLLTEEGAMGFVPWPLELDRRLKPLSVARTATLPAYAPTLENVHRGDYPLRWPVWLVFRRTEAPRLFPLLRQLHGDAIAAALEKQGLMPLPQDVRRQQAFELEVVK